MKSFIKIFGPPIMAAIKELEKIAINMPEVCIMNETITYEIPPTLAHDLGGTTFESGVVGSYFSRRTGVMVPVERCQNIISESGETLGEYDFFFEWFEKPDTNQMIEFIEKIDIALIPLGCLYTITTKL